MCPEQRITRPARRAICWARRWTLPLGGSFGALAVLPPGFRWTLVGHAKFAAQSSNCYDKADAAFSRIVPPRRACAVIAVAVFAQTRFAAQVLVKSTFDLHLTGFPGLGLLAFDVHTLVR